MKYFIIVISVILLTFIVLNFNEFFVENKKETSIIKNTKNGIDKKNKNLNISNHITKRLGNKDVVLCLFEDGSQSDTIEYVTIMKIVRDVSHFHIFSNKNIFLKQLKKIVFEPKSTCFIYYRGKGKWIESVDIMLNVGNVITVCDSWGGFILTSKQPFKSKHGVTTTASYQYANADWNYSKCLRLAILNRKSDILPHNLGLLSLDEITYFSSCIARENGFRGYTQFTVSSAFKTPIIAALNRIKK